MKNRLTYIIGCIAIALIASACEKTLEFDGEETQRLLVLNTFPNPDEELKVELSHSRFFLDNDNKPWEMTGAAVSLWKDGTEIDHLWADPYQPGLYVSDYRPNEGETLRLTASAPGFDPVETTFSIPRRVPIISVDAVNKNPGENDPDYEDYYDERYLVYDLSVKFQDEGDVDNFYRIQTKLELTYQNGDIVYEPMWFERDDIVFGETDVLDMSENEYGEFSDALFDGKEYTVKLGVEHYAYYWGYDTEIISAAIVVELHQITEDFYLYLRTRTASVMAEDFGGLFFEPVQIFNNIEGGIGIAGGYSVDRFRIPMKEIVFGR